MARRLVFVVGTRAQLIKVAPVVAACERNKLPSILLMTGQHHETMQDLIDEFGITSPQIPIMQSAEHSTVFSLLRWLPTAYRGIREKLRDFAKMYGNTTYVLVHGDTLSTLIAAFAARRCGIRVVHLESGLSSGKLFNPFPEELFRRLVFRMTDIALCPNAGATEYMRRRGCFSVMNTDGNSIIDAVRLTGAVSIVSDPNHPYLLVSLHRFQNLYDSKRLRQLVELVESLAIQFSVRFVIHPATRGRLAREGLLNQLASNSNINLLPRMGYRDFIRLAAGAACVLTDGGSNQEELAALGVPTIVMRSYTERPDGLGANAVMEGNVSEGVEHYILKKHFECLRRSPANLSESGPSDRIASFLGGDGDIERQVPA
ncbi:UDP-N-acetylglucosamine 2-epimerase [Rhodanobacter sp. OK091]|uniref:UDP-N-acetylglucosamine 2-epimerase n=1 Tax=Rhodanobacter sp. OK091 TaxID=1881037 RepID=UPI000920F1F0|nr:UDP-N-acetylglucosamine 2-epimerase [Rhodanobacter sp. OK091]SHM29940.1 UDP-N-acetylglucosamine 2-epimerase (non-hydrolysing) [Rhodanobacter sp. OK091]